MSTVEERAEARVARVPAPPAGPWQWSQAWRDVFFLHWPVNAQELRSLLPPALEIDTYDGQAWVSFVGFRLQVRLRNLPHIPFLSQCIELNFRTYVMYRGEPAICFLTMDADHGLIVAAARATTPLPYSLAKIHYRRQGPRCDFACLPSDQRTPRLTASFDLGKETGPAVDGSLDHWLTERYVAFAADKRRVYRLAVQHAPWSLRRTTLQHCESGDCGCTLAGRPLLHYSDGVSALLWPMEVVGNYPRMVE
jgi:uncharacterized protein YqjF (DUF2071 family)